MPRRKICAMLKKRKKIHAEGHEREKNGQVSKRIKQCVLRCPPKKKKEKKKKIKIAHTFKKAFFQKRES
jgi:hypothetical protein